MGRESRGVHSCRARLEVSTVRPSLSSAVPPETSLVLVMNGLQTDPGLLHLTSSWS